MTPVVRNVQMCDEALVFIVPQELCGGRKFPIYNIGSAENDIFLTFSQKKLSFAF
jgi:hypothetical protein